MLLSPPPLAAPHFTHLTDPKMVRHLPFFSAKSLPIYAIVFPKIVSQSDLQFCPNFFFCCFFFLVAFQEVCRDRKSCSRQLRQGLWQARCHRRCHWPEPSTFSASSFFFIIFHFRRIFGDWFIRVWLPRKEMRLCDFVFCLSKNLSWKITLRSLIFV